VHLRSTDIEQENWSRLLWSVPDEWLYLMAAGEEVCVVDKSTHRHGKVERVFVPVLNDLINYFTGYEPENRNLKEHLKLALEALNRDSSLNKKFVFWLRRMNGNGSGRVEVKAKTIHVQREENPLERKGEHAD
jgi:hypothetical protein